MVFKENPNVTETHEIIYTLNTSETKNIVTFLNYVANSELSLKCISTKLGILSNQEHFRSKLSVSVSIWNMILFRSNDLSTDSLKISKESVHLVCLLFQFVCFVPFCVLTEKCYNSTAINKNKQQLCFVCLVHPLLGKRQTFSAQGVNRIKRICLDSFISSKVKAG